VSPDKRDNHQREVRVSSQQRHDTRISKPKRESRVYSTERELHVSEPCPPETSVSELRRKVNIRFLTARVRRELKSPHPQILEASLFDPSLTDLKDYLIKKRSVHQITPLCCCERLITTMLSECHCNQSVFKRLSYTSVSRSAKRRHSRTKRPFFDAEYPEITANMVGPSTTPSKTKGKQPIVSSDESDTEPEGVYWHICTRTGVIAPVDYSALTGASK